MLGRPASCEPVCANVIAGSWLIASVTIERTMQSLSEIFAVCGIRSPINSPVAADGVAPNWDGAIGNPVCPEVIVVRRCPLRTDSGSS